MGRALDVADPVFSVAGPGSGAADGDGDAAGAFLGECK